MRLFGFFRETAAQQRKHRGLFGLETFHGAPKLALGFGLELKDWVAVHVGVQHFRMDDDRLTQRIPHQPVRTRMALAARVATAL